MRKKSKEIKKTKRFYSVRIKLLLAFSLMILLIFLLGIFTYGQASAIIMENYQDTVLQTVEANGKYIRLIMNSIESRATQMVSNENLRRYYTGQYEEGSIDEYNAYNSLYKDLIATVGGDKFISSISILPVGDNPISTDKNFKEGEHLGFLDSQEVEALKNSGEKYIWLRTHPFLDETLGISENNYAATLIRYIYNSGNKVIGYLVLDMKMDAVTSILDEMNIGENAMSLLLLPDGNKIKSSATTPTDLWEINREAAFEDILSDPEESGICEIPYEGNDYLCSYYKIGTDGTLLVHLLDKKVVTGQVEGIRNVLLGVLAIAVLIAISVATYISGDIGRVIERLVLHMQKISDGDLTVTLGNSRKDEFGKLIASISHMVVHIRDLVGETVGVAGSVKNSAGEVRSVGEGITRRAKDMGDALSEMEQGSFQQAEQATQCLDQMNLLSSKIENVNEHNHVLGEMTEHTSQCVDQGMEKIVSLTEQIHDTGEMTKDILSQIELLCGDMRTIGKITVLINEIADQTNLLSLNASIEAAKAGASGRGFAVVAEEIRKLAEQSVSAAEDIGANIKNIVLRSDLMSQKASDMNKALNTQQAAVDDTVGLFRQVDLELGHFMEHMESITHEISEVEQFKVHTLTAMETIAAVVEQNSAMMETISSSAQKQIELVEALEQSTARLQENARTLESSVNLFVLE